MLPDGLRVPSVDRLIDGVRRLAASPWPGWREPGRFTLRSTEEGDRLIEGLPGLPPVRGESGRATPSAGVRLMEGERDPSDGCRLIDGALSRGMEPPLGVRAVPGFTRDGSLGVRRNSSVNEGDRLTDGLDEPAGREGSPVAGRWTLGRCVSVGRPGIGEVTLRCPSAGFAGERVTDGERFGAVNRLSLPAGGRLICPSGRSTEGELALRGESRNCSRPRLLTLGAGEEGRFTLGLGVACRSTGRGAEGAVWRSTERGAAV